MEDAGSVPVVGVAAARPELFFGLVAPVGSDLSRVTDELTEALADAGYQAKTIHLIEQIHELEKWKDIDEHPLDVRIEKHMDAGNELRQLLDSADAVAMLGVGAIQKLRTIATGQRATPVPNTAYILRSLKHHEEIKTLRRIYGDGLYLISAYAPRDNRIEHLAQRIAESHHRFQLGEFRAKAELLNQRDEAELDDKFGQNVRKTFPKADVFIDASDPNGAKQSIRRFIDLLFGYPFHTPTKDEFAMFHSQAAALRSAALGRQVGAVIATADGDIVAIGTNDVPKAGGGLYWCDDSPDHRDFTLGYDTNDRIKANIVGDILQLLREAGWLADAKRNTDIRKLVEESIKGDHPILPRTAQVMNLTEFSRTVHAEMAALSDAARRGAAVGGCVLYTTTFPCHNCAKHIVAAGIKRVVYVEPYPKSLAMDLHLDSIEVDGAGCGREVEFRPFVGISPRRYMDLFTADERKLDDGRIMPWSATASFPRFPSDYPGYVLNETQALTIFSNKLEQKNLKPVE
jgi:cytidine deaminase